MIFERTDIEKKLSQVKGKTTTEKQVLEQVYQILHSTDSWDDTLTKNWDKTVPVRGNDFVFDYLETDRIYHIDQIKKICTDYRLRFLDAKYFKGELPPEAISAIKRLEKLHSTELKGYKIMAPSKLFKLEDKDDPLLFVPIGNQYYYLIHKWGKDLHPLRKLLVWPFKSIVNLALTTFVFSYIVTLLIPDGLFSKKNTSAEFWMMFFFMFKSVAAIVIFYGFSMGKNFNPAIWNSKYFNG